MDNVRCGICEWIGPENELAGHRRAYHPPHIDKPGYGDGWRDGWNEAVKAAAAIADREIEITAAGPRLFIDETTRRIRALAQKSPALSDEQLEIENACSGHLVGVLGEPRGVRSPIVTCEGSAYDPGLPCVNTSSSGLICGHLGDAHMGPDQDPSLCAGTACMVEGCGCSDYDPGEDDPRW